MASTRFPIFKKEGREGKGVKSSSTEEEEGSIKANQERRRGFFLSSFLPLFSHILDEGNLFCRETTHSLPPIFFLFLSSVEATPTILIIPELLQPKRGEKRRDYRTYFSQIIFRKREKVPLRQNQFYALLTRQAESLPFTTQQTINPRGLTKKGRTGGGGMPPLLKKRKL